MVKTSIFLKGIKMNYLLNGTKKKMGIRQTKHCKIVLDSPNEYALGKGNKWEGAFFIKNMVWRKHQSKVIFDFNGKELLIEREFAKNEQTSLNSEDVSIYYDSQKQTQAFIDNILPKNFAQFFFLMEKNLKI